MWWAALTALPALALLAGWQKFGVLRPGLLTLGAAAAAAACGLRLVQRLLAPGLGPAFLWGSLAGGAAQAALMALLVPFSGLTWMLVAPFHLDAVFVGLAACASAALLRGPLAGRWPRGGPGRQPDGAGRGLALLLAWSALALAALAVGLAALTLDAPTPAAAGLKGLVKSPGLLHWALALAGLGAAAATFWRPGFMLLVFWPGAGFGLLWGGWVVRLMSAMEPLQAAMGPEVLQALALASCLWLGWALAAEGYRPGPKAFSMSRSR